MTISLERLRRQIAEDLATAHPDDRATFELLAVEPELVPIVGDARHDHVWVVAQSGTEAIFYDDVEGGFNVSPVVDGKLTEPRYSQDTLGGAIHTWNQPAGNGA